MLKTAALAFGVVFVLIGILGFIPAFNTPADGGNTLLLGIFGVDAVHNWVHILSGVAALAASTKASLSRLYFQVFGVVYGLVTLLGFIVGHGELLGIMHINGTPDNLLHLVIAAAALYLGFVHRDNDATAPAQQM